MIRLKEGVKVAGVKPEIIIALETIAGIFKKHCNEDVTITELTGGKHMENSLHYKGLAADIRTHAFSQTLTEFLLKEMKAALGSCGYDIILEDAGLPNEHFHVEYDPK